ncbi:putative nucleotidyltransferase [Clostridium sartagoforme AAU1]|uniref:Putative nucleotidyltransferase n=1 Tax=Clostridium sartagoforme AAU1 TaxID=1202534 RepID=R9CCL2_9CLOT|nr:nucleotidyltransferase domain-containing protein [Clostridium sartagoforme]EOR27032.1 putative nucleotidyltransferase [Clostridium sartagoforme AAU1]
MIIKKILDEITTELKGIPGIVGIVLGGSRARGTNHQDSDIDIGIYYNESEGFKVSEIDKIATKLDDEHRINLVSSLGEWGPWVNAGGWLVIQGYRVDFIFRDVKRVSKVIDDCLNGKISSNYQTGHPHAYLNSMYMGEVAICKILDDPKNKITELKEKTIPYSENLRNAIIGWYMFEASFSLMFAKSNIDKDDISYVCGHCFRSISSLNQVLFALNNEYCINEKKAVKMIDAFKTKPQNYKKRIDELITLISFNESNTRKGVEILEELVNEVKALC